MRRPKIVRKFWDFFEASLDKRIWVLYGGKNSCKSHSTAQKFALDLYRYRNNRSLATRATGPALKDSCFQAVTDVLETVGRPHKVNRSLGNLQVSAGGNKMLFRALDRRHKLTSVNYNDAWIEEPTWDLTIDDFTVVNLQARRPNENGINHIVITCNPDNPHSFVKTDLIDGVRDDVAVMHSTVYDNPFATDAQIQQLEWLRQQNISKWLALCKGEWAAPEGTIYNDYLIKSASTFPKDEEFDEIGYALDYGYSNSETALLKIDIIEKQAYIRELLYTLGMRIDQLIRWMEKHKIPKEALIVADVRPDQLDELREAGFNVESPEKFKGYVEAKIEFAQTWKWIIDAEAENTIKEIRGYVWATDSSGRFLNKPVKFQDHSMDAVADFLYFAQHGGQTGVY